MQTLDISVEIVEKSETDWLWTVYSSDGALIDCGHDPSPKIAKESIMKTLGNVVDGHIREIRSPRSK